MIALFEHVHFVFNYYERGALFLGVREQHTKRGSTNWTSFFPFHLPKDSRLRGYNKRRD